MVFKTPHVRHYNISLNNLYNIALMGLVRCFICLSVTSWHIAIKWLYFLLCIWYKLTIFQRSVITQRSVIPEVALNAPGQGHSLIFVQGHSEWNWISGERYRTIGPLVLNSFWDQDKCMLGVTQVCDGGQIGPLVAVDSCVISQKAWVSLTF